MSDAAAAQSSQSGDAAIAPTWPALSADAAGDIETCRASPAGSIALPRDFLVRVLAERGTGLPKERAEVVALLRHTRVWGNVRPISTRNNVSRHYLAMCCLREMVRHGDACVRGAMLDAVYKSGPPSAFDSLRATWMPCTLAMIE